MCDLCDAYSALLQADAAALTPANADAINLLQPAFDTMAEEIERSDRGAEAVSTREVDSAVVEAVTAPAVAVEETVVADTVKSLTSLLTEFAASADALDSMEAVFGESANALSELLDAWRLEDFSSLPKIELVPIATLNGANGAYSAELKTVFLAREYVDLYRDHAPELIALLAEELGHHIDRQVNGDADSAGDEGAIFAALLQGKTLTGKALTGEALTMAQQEVDAASVVIEGRTLSVEQNLGPQIEFEDVTATASTFIAGRSYGAGSWGDFNGDGLPDLWVNNHFGPAANLYNRNLYINDGDGTFTDIVQEVLAGSSDIFIGSELQGDYHGAAWVDFDNDGDDDLIQLVGGEGNTSVLGKENLPPDSEPNRLYINDNGVLRDQAREYGLAYDSAKAQAPIWFDYDNDGKLDLFHGSTQRADGRNPSTIFRQTDSGFEDVGSTLLPADIQNRTIKYGGLGDFRNGGALELAFPGRLAAILDTQTAPFTHLTDALAGGTGPLKGARDLAVADFDNDLRMDVYFTRGGQPDRILLNKPGGFVDASEASGINAVSNSPGAGVVAADFNNDMHVDIYVVRGAGSDGVNLDNVLYANQGDGTFKAVANSGGAVSSEIGIGDNVTFADYDVDGFIDLFVTNGTSTATNGPQQLFRNKGNDNHWIQIDLEGVDSNRDGIGAQVFVTAGGVTQRRDQDGGIHERSQNFKRLHFGLANNEQIDEIEIRWPSGAVQKIQNVAADQVLTVTEENNSTLPPSAETLLFSVGNAVQLNGQLRAENDDIVAYDDGFITLRFDGSDVGIGKKIRLDAFDQISENEILMSFNQEISLPGVGLVDDSDIVKFNATSLGEETAGTFELYFDGSDVGLTKGAADIDAITGLPDGSLLISTLGKAGIPGFGQQDEDLLLFTPTSLGANTAGSWSMYMDGSDIGFAEEKSEDINGATIDRDGRLLLSTVGDFAVDGLSGKGADIMRFTPSGIGETTTGTFDSSLLLQGDGLGMSRVNIASIDVFDSAV